MAVVKEESDIQRTVVKLSGHKYNGRVGISYHGRTEVTSIVNDVEELAKEIGEGCAVLVEEFGKSIVPVRTGSCQSPIWSTKEGLGFRVRTNVCRDHDDTPVTTLINCAIADKHLPINGDNTVCQSLDSTLLAYGIHNEAERMELEMEIRKQLTDVLRLIMDREKLLSKEERGSFRGQTDVIGVDTVVTKHLGKLVPVEIAVKGHSCSMHTQLYDFMADLGECMVAIPTCKSGIPSANTETKLMTFVMAQPS